MALRMNYDFNTGLELDGMYFRIDKINFNDTHFQVIATGYASEKAYRSGSRPISDPRAYTLENYDKEKIASIFNFSYEVLKSHPVFKDAEDVIEDGQTVETFMDELDIAPDENGNLKGYEVIRPKEND